MQNPESVRPAAQSGPNAVEIGWDVDGIRVEGTLTLPAGSGPHPAVIFVAGSGPTDRDWNSPLLPGKNGSAALLAAALTEAGFVTLRYDKRASGPHAQANVQQMIGKVSFKSHVDELAGGVAALAARPEVDPTRLFVLTNSEGVIHGLNYQRQASKRRFAGLVLTAPPGRAVGEVARGQVAEQLAAIPGGDALLAQYDAAVVEFVADQPMTGLDALPQGIQLLLRSLATPANQPFARELWMTNPADLLQEIAEPVLIVIGQKDIQVDWRADGQAWQTAAADRGNVTFVFPRDANHILKYEAKPRTELVAADATASYNTDGGVLDPAALTAIRDWLVAHSSK